MSLNTIAFHQKQIAEWLDYIHETLPQVDILSPTAKPTKDNKSDSEGDHPQYGEKYSPFELSAVAKVKFDRLPPR